MWISNDAIPVPRTRKPMYMTCRDGHPYCVKPGKGYYFHENVWVTSKSLSLLNDKIDRVVVSPNGGASLHLPKITPTFAIHSNKPEPNVTLFPLPSCAQTVNSQEVLSFNVVDPNGTKLLVSTPPQRVGDVSYAMNMQNKVYTNFPSHVRGLSVSESGKIIAVSVDDSLWIWQQLPEQPTGIGWWTDLTADKRFGINIQTNHPYSQQGQVYHGFMRERQTFTLHPAISPNLPANTAISYQDLALFDNPDEGKGVVCLTAVMPPSKPFDTLYLFVSICKFCDFVPVFERAEVTLPIVEGPGGPCIFWSLCCRIAVVAVSRSLVIITRELRVIKIIPLESVFADPNAMVASVAWSCSGQFFVVTSTQGEISAITRSGKSMRHSICSLEPFDSQKQVPLIACGDTKDPLLFTIYTRERMKLLKFNNDMIAQTIENLMSLHFPFGNVADFYDPAVDAIRNIDFSKIENFTRLIYLTDLFRIFPYMSPLRYTLIQIFDAETSRMLDEGRDLYAFLFSRCIFRLADHKIPIYDIVKERLGGSSNQRDRILSKIMDDEENLKDWVVTHNYGTTNIIMYDKSHDEQYEDDEDTLSKPDAKRSADLPLITKRIRKLLFEGSFSDINELDVDMRVVLELMLSIGRVDRAVVVARHQSIASDPLSLYKRIVALYPDNPEIIFRSLIYCITVATPDENEIRATCIKTLLNILKQRVSESMPTATKPSVPSLSALCMIEESLEIIVPSSQKDLSDFAVILAIAFCAADFKNIVAFINGRSKVIPESLKGPIRELFGIVWFIRWRQTAISETARVRHANDATLRLLAFPEFVNIKAAMNQINQVGPRAFSPDAFALYIDGKRNFEDDPLFPQYMAECTNRIRQGSLRNVQDAVVRIGEKNMKELPKSNLLLATVVSHMIPWLRCGIPRALSGFECGEVIPSELLDIEDFTIPARAAQNMVIETKPIVNEAAEQIEEESSDDSDIPVMEPPRPLQEESIHESTSGEVHLPPKEESVSLSSVSDDSRKRRHHHHHSRPKPEKKHKKSKPVETPKIRLLSLDPNASSPYSQYIPPPPQYMPRPMPQQRPMQFGNIWDIDPSQWRKPERKPEKMQKEVQAEQQPKFVFVSSKRDTIPEPELSMSSSISSIEFAETKHEPIRPQDPFPLDDELNARISRALNDFDQTPKQIPERPKYYRPPVVLANQPPTTAVPQIQIPQQAQPAKGKDESLSDDLPEFQPAVRSMKKNKVIGVTDNSSKPKRVLVLKEITDEK